MSDINYQEVGLWSLYKYYWRGRPCIDVEHCRLSQSCYRGHQIAFCLLSIVLRTKQLLHVALGPWALAPLDCTFSKQPPASWAASFSAAAFTTEELCVFSEHFKLLISGLNK